MSETSDIGSGAGRGDRIARKVIVPLVVLLVVVIGVFYVLFDVTIVSGPSMEPGLHDGDRLLLTKAYTEPHDDDVVVFHTLGENGDPEDLIKRVVAVEGQSVSVSGGVATVDGVTESTARLVTSPDDTSSVATTTILPDFLFVMGDNRPISLDSRYLGAVAIDSVRGRAVFRFAPLNRIGFVR